MKEKILIWLAWHMPRSLAKWAFVRVATAATVGEYSEQVLPELLVTTALQRWEPPSRSNLQPLPR